jgi:hypothetical protein
MPETNTSAYFRGRSAEFRILAKKRGKAGHRESSTMLRGLASEFEAEADELDGKNDV